MKKLTTSILACGILASGLLTAGAGAALRVSADNGATWLVINDNDLLDVNTNTGVVRYDGPIGNWSFSISRGQTDPFSIGTPAAPDLDVHAINFSSQAASLIIQFCETNLITFPTETYINVVSYNTTGSVIQKSYRDSGNVLFGTTATYPSDASGISPSGSALLLSSVGPVSGADTVSNGVVVAASGSVPNSLTIETIINHSGAGNTVVDTHLYALPQPPCNCALTFNSPTTITNCPDETIPDVTASQNCGFGPVSVPVTLTSITTNGTCPLLVTRNYTATDNCGTVYPFTQLVVINCKPDCTITPSVTTALVGGTNYTAQVADAGFGATYSWTVMNGTITDGQNTPKITWTAGSDTNSPISIIVTVTAPTGCQSTCSASVKLTPQPPKICLGHGDTATIGFWNNKNGQAIINGASNSPALANWLASNFPCLYGALAGKPNSTVAALFQSDFGVKGAKTDAQVLAGAFACYFTSTSLGGGTLPVKFGFNQSTGGTGTHTFNIGSNGTILGLQNNTSYTIMQILQAASAAKCNPSINQATLANVLNTIFDAINQGGDIS